MLLKRMALCMAMLLMLCAILPAALAEDAADVTVTLNDGAEIPYLNGYQSRFVKDAQSIRGITGAASCRWTYETVKPKRQIHMEMQNIALTDDVLVLFFTQTTDEPITYEAQMHAGYGWTVMPYFSLRVDDQPVTLDTIYREGHPLDEHTEACMVAYSLETPLASDAVLTLRADDPVAAIRFDRRAAEDPTVAVTPMQEVSMTLSPWEDEPPVDYHFIIERVAWTPFGGRVLMNYQTVSDNDAYLSYKVLDDKGSVLPTYTSTVRSNGLASKEHPQWVRNEAWFLGGEGSTAYTIAPVGAQPTSATGATVIALDSLPADVTLDNGKTIRIERCHVLPDGFEVAYQPQDYVSSNLAFDLADAAGESLNLNYVISEQYAADHVCGLLAFDAYWSAEYKGSTVAKVSPDEIAQAKQLIIRYGITDPPLLVDEAIIIRMAE